MKKKQDVV